MGLPTLWAVARARRYLEEQGALNKVSILAAGGLTEPGQFLKAIALGATACYSASAIVLSLLSDQIDNAVMKMAPPYALVLQSTQYLNDELNEERATQNVVQLFEAWHQEWDLALRAMGKTRVTELSVSDLVARTRELAETLEIAHVAGPLWRHPVPGHPETEHSRPTLQAH